MNDVLGNRYQIIKKIGSGGMAIVYLAKDLSLDRKVAIKVLRDEYTEDSTFRRHFQKEAVAIARLSHNNIVGIYDILTDDETMCLVMEYVEGETLKDKINRDGAIPWQQAVKYAIQIANGLEYAHANQIIHKDVKSQNILIDKYDNVKITDFGISQMMNNTTITHNKGVLGSAHYFSPEQARGEKLSYQTDIYSLGIVLYEMLVGELPFTADNPVSVALKHIQEKPRSVHSIMHDVPESLSFIVSKCLEKKPEDRFASMQALCRALSSLSSAKNRPASMNAGKTITTVAATAAVADAAKNASQAQAKGKDGQQAKNEPARASKPMVKDSVAKKSASEKSSTSPKTAPNKKPKKKKTNLLVLVLIVLAVIGATMILAQQIAPPSEITAPDFRGMTFEEAQNEAAKYELTLQESGSDFSDEYKEGTICAQTPQEGSNVSKGDTISVVISQGAENRKVPNLVGQTLDSATEMLEEEDLAVGDVTENYSSSVAAGLVISQGINANTEVAPNTAINLVLSLGPKPTSIVPELRGQDLNSAKAALSAANLSLGNVRYEESSEAEGIVIGQGYNPNDVVDEYTSVDLVISSGPGEEENEDESSNGQTNYKEVSITAPSDGNLKITLNDDNGEQTVYWQDVKQGEVISGVYAYVGNAKFTATLDNTVIQEITAQ